MIFQINQNEQGIRNLYFGHPFSKESYTNAVIMKTPVFELEGEFDGVYSGKEIDLNPMDTIKSNPEDDVEYRIIRGTKSMFIGDYETILKMHDDVGLYHSMCSRASVKVNNPNYLDFDVYTKKILGDPLKNIFDVKSVTPEQTKKYMDYAVLYDKDKQYSDRLLVKPYFVSCDTGVLVLTEDFVDFNLNLKVDRNLGVVGIKFWMSGNSSKYTRNYKEI